MPADPTQSEVEAIVARLTKAQGRSLMEAEDMMSNHGGYPFFVARITCNPWPQGVAQFLTLNTDRLTPLGLAVRTHLQRAAALSKLAALDAETMDKDNGHD